MTPAKDSSPQPFGDLLEGLLHKLSQPLTAARGTLELSLLFGRTPEDFRASIREAMSLLDRIGQIRTVISEFAAGVELTSGAQRLSVFAVLVAAVETQRVAAQAGGVRMVTSCPDPGYAYLNSGRFCQCLSTFIEGMIHYSRSGSTISILCLNVADNCTIAISNPQGSIPEGDLPQLFDPFYTFANKSRESGPGFALARRALESAGGTVRAENVLGGGFRFQIRVPLEGAVAQRTSAA